MSNKIRIFFLTYLIVLPFGAKTTPFPSSDSLITRANQAYDYEDYETATDIYEELVSTGFFHEKMLYRLAYMHEQAGNFPQSIYYLRKLQWEIGGEHLDDKVDQLMDLNSRGRLSSGENWPTYRLLINHYRWWLIGSMIALGLMAAILVIPRLGAILRAVGLISAAISVVIGLVLIQHYWFHDTKAVLMKPSALYDLPAYSASFQKLPVGEGATVTILDEKDIWCLIGMDKFKGWVPKFVLREI